MVPADISKGPHHMADEASSLLLWSLIFIPKDKSSAVHGMEIASFAFTLYCCTNLMQVV
jgi:hypothetical protein